MLKRFLPAGRTALLALLLGALFGGAIPAAAQAQDRLAAPNWADPRDDKMAPEILVYYFHNTFRCRTCLTMENMAEELLRDEFVADLETGILAWRSINLQEPEYSHFGLQYGLNGPSLVMTEWNEHEELRWKNLKRIWELVDSPEQYRAYVRGELQDYLDGEPDAVEKE
jgi:hypothetical protein